MRLAAPLLLAVAAIAVWLLWPHDVQRVHAVFDATHGLVEGGEVRAGGVHVGTVEQIALRDGRPNVTLALDGDYRVRRGTTADLRLASLSGEVNRYVALEGGSGRPLPDGATLGLARTDQPVEIEEVLSTLDPSTRAQVRDVLAGLRVATRGRGEDIGAALEQSTRALGSTALALNDVTADEPALRELVRSMRATAGALARDPGATSGAIDSVASLLRDTAARETDLAAAVRRLPAGLSSARRALRTARGDAPLLRALVRDLRPAARQLPAAAGELDAVLRRNGGALRALRHVTGTAPGSLRALSPLLRDAAPVLDRLGPVLRDAEPITRDLRVRTPDFFSFFSNWADFTANYDANGHGARVGLVFPPAPTQQIDGDENTAGHLRAPFLRKPGVLEGEPWSGK